MGAATKEPKRRVLGNRRRKRTDWGFSRGLVYQKDRIYLLSFLRELEEDGESVTQVLRWSGDWVHWLIEFSVSALSILEKPELQVVSMGTGGLIHVKAASGESEEHVDQGRSGPAYRGMLRDMRRIGDTLYVTGMSRQVYRRLGPGQWERFDDGVLAPKGRSKGTGFNSIDGFSEDGIFAVGWGGEIWRFDGSRWIQIQSPTNLVLARVLCTETGDVWACGQAGTLLRGEGDRWSSVEQTATEDDFWGMTWFQDRLWLATLDGVFALEPGADLEPVEMGRGGDLTCGWLDAADGVLWSVGPEDLAYFDGERWTEVILA